MLKRLTGIAAAAVTVTGAMIAGTTPAHADHFTRGDRSILGGNQISVPVSIPVNVCGNALAISGSAGAGCKGGAKANRHVHY